jgi:signal transduction histidine kinase
VLHESEFSLDDLLAEECGRVLALAEAKALRLTAQSPPRPIRLKTDRTKLVRVLDNLIGNAVKFTKAGNVTVAAALTPEGAVEIRVRDTGIGIAPDDVGHVFEEFAQVGDSKTGRNAGWGLGLAICRRFVELMDGTIGVESEPHVGTVFTIRLPASCVVGHGIAASSEAGRR